jgi:hypothetical protein
MQLSTSLKQGDTANNTYFTLDQLQNDKLFSPDNLSRASEFINNNGALGFANCSTSNKPAYDNLNQAINDREVAQAHLEAFKNPVTQINASHTLVSVTNGVIHGLNTNIENNVPTFSSFVNLSSNFAGSIKSFMPSSTPATTSASTTPVSNQITPNNSFDEKIKVNSPDQAANCSTSEPKALKFTKILNDETKSINALTSQVTNDLNEIVTNCDKIADNNVTPLKADQNSITISFATSIPQKIQFTGGMSPLKILPIVWKTAPPDNVLKALNFTQAGDNLVVTYIGKLNDSTIQSGKYVFTVNDNRSSPQSVDITLNLQGQAGSFAADKISSISLDNTTSNQSNAFNFTGASGTITYQWKSGTPTEVQNAIQFTPPGSILTGTNSNTLTGTKLSIKFIASNKISSVQTATLNVTDSGKNNPQSIQLTINFSK